MTKVLEDYFVKIKDNFLPKQEFTWIECLKFMHRPRYNLERLYNEGKLKRRPITTIGEWMYWYEA